MPGRFDLVIFDNDGVLVDSEWHANGILADPLGEAGLPSTREGCIAEYMGSSLARVREIAEGRLGRPLPTDLEDRYHERLFEAFRTKLTAVPGVVEALARFEGRIFSAQDVARGKPEPDLFLHAATTLGIRPERGAVVEDSPLGVEAANRARMTAFGFARMMPAERLRHAAGGVFGSMDELPGLLARPS